MRNWLTRLKHWTYRMLGIVSPSGQYPPPPSWAMRKKEKK